MMKLFVDDEPHDIFLLIDNKSFYAGCEAIARGLSPLKVLSVALNEAENINGGLTPATPPEARVCSASKNTSAAFLRLLSNRSYFMVH